jgi:hypothetical protein
LQPGSDIQQLAIVPQPSSASPRSPRSKGAGRRCYEVWVFLWISLWVVKRKRLTGASQARCVRADGPAMALVRVASPLRDTLFDCAELCVGSCFSRCAPICRK